MKGGSYPGKIFQHNAAKTQLVQILYNSLNQLEAFFKHYITPTFNTERQWHFGKKYVLSRLQRQFWDQNSHTHTPWHWTFERIFLYTVNYGKMATIGKTNSCLARRKLYVGFVKFTFKCENFMKRKFQTRLTTNSSNEKLKLMARKGVKFVLFFALALFVFIAV